MQQRQSFGHQLTSNGANGAERDFVLGASPTPPVGGRRSDCHAGVTIADRPAKSRYSTMCVARSNIEAGIATLSAFAARRFAPSSKSLGLPMGRSPGLAPFRILSTREALRRNSIER